MKEGLYFIAILPPDDIAGKVQAVKKEFADNYDSQEAYRRPAHFTMQPPFKKPERDESKIIEAVSKFAGRQQPFMVQLNGFNYFRDDVIYIDIANPVPMQSLYRNLITFLQAECNFTDDMIRNQKLNPHMTVAYRDLSSGHFQKAWKVFSKRTFNYRFKVTSIFLLKHDSKRWQPHHEFHFRKS